jgi:DMSO/TMAO reductase YedYZ molybdopterin-dependent catalytic subunit
MTRLAPDMGTEQRRWLVGFAATMAIWLPLVLVVTPVMGAGAFGRGLPDSSFAYSASLLLSVGAFSVLVVQLQQIVLSRGALRYDGSRREFVRKAVIISAFLVIGGWAVRSLVTNVGRLTPVISVRHRGALSTEITPNDQFYVVAKSAVVPGGEAADWILRVDQGVENPYRMTYDELIALPSIEETVTLTCISNPIGGELISTAVWKGVPLRVLLERAGVPRGTERIAFTALDGYFDSFPLDIAMRDDVIVAYLMNGEQLPRAHGFPARIIVPGLYGMEHVKWLSRIEPVDADFRGFWQRRGWADTAIINTMSRVDIPSDDGTLRTPGASIAGVAFAGLRGIAKIEVSVDGGASWRPATVKEPLSAYTWMLWNFDWPEAPLGRHDVLVRATDGEGTVQIATRKQTFPSGAEAHHKIRVTVRKPEPTPTPRRPGPSTRWPGLTRARMRPITIRG